MYKQVLLLLALSAAATAHAAPIFKCVDAQGATSFQSLPCPGKSTQTEVVVRKEPGSPSAGSTSKESQPMPEQQEPAQRLAPPPSAPAAPAPAPAQAQPPGKVSYQCTAANGLVFYVHDQPCPSEMAIEGFNQKLGGKWSSLPVKQKIVPRREACHEMNRASYSDRAGHELDQHTSTYDKALGRDPCR